MAVRAYEFHCVKNERDVGESDNMVRQFVEIKKAKHWINSIFLVQKEKISKMQRNACEWTRLEPLFGRFTVSTWDGMVWWYGFNGA